MIAIPTTSQAGVITPTGYALDMLEGLLRTSVTGSPARIAGELRVAIPLMERQGDSSLVERMREAARRLDAGELTRPDWGRTRLLGDLQGVAESIREGSGLGEALNGYGGESGEGIRFETGFGPRLKPRVLLRESVGPLPEIRWEQYGDDRHPAPHPPSADLVSAGRLFHYAFKTVASYIGVGVGENRKQIAQFFGIPESTVRQIERGLFVPKRIGDFPTDVAGAILLNAGKINPLYQRLLKDLLTWSAFEAYGWNLGKPVAEAPWDLYFLYYLRLYACQLLMTPRGRVQLTEDRGLYRVVQRKASLEEVSWYPAGKTRRDLFEGWIGGMTGEAKEGAPETARRRGKEFRKGLGEKILRSTGLSAPKSGARWQRQIQWALQQWACVWHYGAFPAWGLPFSTGRLRGLFWADFHQLTRRLTPQVAHGLVAMMAEHWGESAERYLTGIIPE